MEQLASTAWRNADQARDAGGNASAVTRTAEDGGQVREQVNLAMTAIETNFGKISNIVGIIDDNASQTNPLALNASLEAAGASEAGKGFAVVAVEVRGLAQSAASASADVKVMIEQSSSEVKGGSRRVAHAASKLDSILMEDIARESHEQTSAIHEVNVGVRQMDEMNQHNAALVEQTYAEIEQT